MSYVFAPTGDLSVDLTKIYTDASGSAKPMSASELAKAEAAAIIAGVEAEVAGVPYENTPANIKMDGTQAVGALSTVARGDHVHPSDTSKMSASATTANISDSTDKRYVTDAEKTAISNMKALALKMALIFG